MDPDTDTVRAGAIDRGAVGVERFRVYHVRFQVLNDSDAAATLRAVLEFGPGTSPALSFTVPSGGPTRDRAFYTSAGDGRSDGHEVATIEAADLRLGASIDPEATAIDGLAALGTSSPGAIELAAHTFTEVDFAFRATADATWDATYTLRLAQRGPAPVIAAATARLTMGAKPAIELTPGQRRGLVVDDPIPLYELRQPQPAWAVQLGATPQALIGPFAPAAFTSPHVDFVLTGDSCAACHTSHVAQGPLLARTSPESSICFSCHDGTGATSDVKGQFEDPGVPANDAATASWYAHPATALSDHASDRQDEFGGTLDRHAACADCHQPHLADGTVPVQTTGGWTASGAISGASGVSVVNGPAGTSPTYTWNPTSMLEYELCFKCHSGFTQLPANDPAHPSRWSLDKGVELNPSNASYHPIQAAGTNATAAMTNSLSGTSPYKLWTFQADSTIRCVNCHGDSRLADPASPPTAAARLAPHAVPDRSLLMAPYRDRQLKPAAEPYAASDFALCYQCHAESPMVDWSGDRNSATNFPFHGYHLLAIDAEGNGGLDIDTDGHGEGNAICAECHFRIHGSSEAVDGQGDNARLVNFSPNVQPYRGVLEWTGTAGGGSCTLICHGITHSGDTYP